MHKMGQTGDFLGRVLGPLLETGLPLMESVPKPLAKSILLPLQLTAAKSAADVAINKKIFGSSTTTLVFSNEDLNDGMKIIKSFEESGLLIKSASETTKNEAKEQWGCFLSMYKKTSIEYKHKI